MTLVALLLVKAVSHVLLPTCWHGFIWSAVFTHLEHIVMGAGRLPITRLFERISLLNNLTKREKYWLFPSVFLFSIRYPALKLLISMRQTYMMCGVMYSVYVCVCVLLCWHKDIPDGDNPPQRDIWGELRFWMSGSEPKQTKLSRPNGRAR